MYHQVMIRVSLESMKEAETLLVGQLVVMHGLKRKHLRACPCKNRPLKFSWKMDCLHFFYTGRATYAMNENGLYFDRFAFLIF